MVTRFIEKERDIDMLARFLKSQALPLVVGISPGSKRTNQQNRLGRQWFNDIHAQLPGESAEYWRGYCKLCFGVPILRAELEGYADKYDAMFKPLPFAQKLALMQEPFDFAVTRLMSVKQHTAYLDAIHRHFSEQGVVLTDPATLGMEAMRVAA